MTTRTQELLALLREVFPAPEAAAEHGNSHETRGPVQWDRIGDPEDANGLNLETQRATTTYAEVVLYTGTSPLLMTR